MNKYIFSTLVFALAIGCSSNNDSANDAGSFQSGADLGTKQDLIGSFEQTCQAGATFTVAGFGVSDESGGAGGGAGAGNGSGTGDGAGAGDGTGGAGDGSGTGDGTGGAGSGGTAGASFELASFVNVNQARGSEQGQGQEQGNGQEQGKGQGDGSGQEQGKGKGNGNGNSQEQGQEQENPGQGNGDGTGDGTGDGGTGGGTGDGSGDGTGGGDGTGDGTGDGSGGTTATSVQNTLEVTEDKMTMITRAFSTNDCTGDEILEARVVADYTIKNYTAGQNNEVDMTLVSATLEPKTNEAANLGEDQKLCGISNWTADQEKSIVGSDCLPNMPENTGEKFFQTLNYANNNLKLGALTDEQSGTSDENRPTELVEPAFVRSTEGDNGTGDGGGTGDGSGNGSGSGGTGDGSAGGGTGDGSGAGA